MSWVRIDDDIVDNPKTLKVWKRDPEAFALDVRAIAYCAKHLTDGLVGDEILELWYAGNAERLQALTEILVDVGRWDRVDDGFQIHDFLDYNYSREEVVAIRAKRKRAGGKGGKASGESRRAQVRAEIDESLDQAKG